MGEKIAVIGLGVTGVAALKNLREVGLDAVGFDKNLYLGGLWRYTTDENTTSVTKKTRSNNSRQKLSYADFPWPDEASDYPDAADIANYINQYAEHNKLLPHCRLGLGVHRLERSTKSALWDLTLKDTRGELITEQFSKVLITTGPQNEPVKLHFDGMEHFKGKVIHSRSFKDAKPFADQRVLVVGLSNTGGDVVAELSEVCPEVFVSHRSGLFLVNRSDKGQTPTDHIATRRLNRLILTMNKYAPTLTSFLGSFGLALKMKYGMKVKPEWKLLPAHPIGNVPPVMNDYLVPLLHAGRVKSLPAISSFAPDGHTVHFTDSTTLSNIDTVIFCTGYSFDYTWLDAHSNPTVHPTPEWDAHPNSNSMPFPRLYRGIFSLDHPDSLAFIGAYRGHSISAFVNADLTSTAVAQVWRGHYALPPRRDMDRWCDAHYAAMLRHIRTWRTVQVGQNAKEFEAFLNAAAGNGLNEKLGWGWEGWAFMLRNWSLYRVIMDGVDTPFVYRLFDSPRGAQGRKKWDGAEEWVWRTNGKEPPARKKDV